MIVGLQISMKKL